MHITTHCEFMYGKSQFSDFAFVTVDFVAILFVYVLFQPNNMSNGVPKEITNYFDRKVKNVISSEKKHLTPPLIVVEHEPMIVIFS